MNRNLDGCYFRVNRNEKWQNVCFSDLTEEEQNEVLKDKGIEYLKSLCIRLASTIKTIGEEFDIITNDR